MSKKGTLIQDPGSDRMIIRYGLTEYGTPLHCGDVLEVKVGGHWKRTRIEYGDNGWYLVGIRTGNLIGLMAREG